MASVYIFAALGRFKSVAEMRQFIDMTYTEDGDGIDSAFIREVGLSAYEPNCIEAVWSESPKPLKQLLQGASYCDQWLPGLSISDVADLAICVFEPNMILHPERSSLRYCGVYTYDP
jgi:hypothetical protein